MSMVYYRDSHLKSDFKQESRIKITDLQFIIDRNLKRRDPRGCIQITSAGIWNFVAGRGGRFLFGQINSKEQLFQTPDRGYFYVPKSIVFFDKRDYYYPSVYYFVSVMGDFFEIRKCNAGKGTVWTDIADSHTLVEDKKIVRRIENSIEGLKQYFSEQ